MRYKEVKESLSISKIRLQPEHIKSKQNNLDKSTSHPETKRARLIRKGPREVWINGAPEGLEGPTPSVEDKKIRPSKERPRQIILDDVPNEPQEKLRDVLVGDKPEKPKQQESNQQIYLDELGKTLEDLELGEYGIGVHGTDIQSAENITREGLKISYSRKTILSTAISLGPNDKDSDIGIRSYRFGNGEQVNIVIAAPQYIQNKEGQTIYLGFPEENGRTAGQQYEEHCILDRICSKRGSVPSEFILGYYSNGTFVRNPEHYSTLDEEKREDLYQDLYSNMDNIAKNFNDLIDNGKVAELQGMKERLQAMKMPTQEVDTAINLTQKYRSKDKVIDRINSLREERNKLLNHEIAQRRNAKEIRINDIPEL